MIMAIWKVEDGTAKKNQYTTISNDGVLYVGLGQSKGTLTVKGGESEDVLDSATVTVQVDNIVVPSSALLDNSASGTRQFTMKIRDTAITGGAWSLKKTTSTEIASDTTISNTGLLSWSTKQKSGQIQVVWSKDGVEKTINVVFKKSKVAVSPKTVTVGNGDTQQFTVA
jgi:hypothetical protein